MSDTIKPNIAGLIQAGWERNAYLACGTLITYEYFLQLPAEVEFFWKQRWSLAKCLFLWSRYYSLGYNISNAVIFMQPEPSFKLYVVAVALVVIMMNSPSDLTDLTIGNTFFHWQNTGASLQVITTHIILELRLYAMYESSRKILALFICLTFGEALAMGLVFGIPNPKLIGTNEPFPGNFICADADPLDGSHWVVYYWAAVLVIEGILLILALYKAWQHRALAGGSGLMQQLTKQSVVYFFTIFWIYVANLILWYINRITLDELGTAFAFVLSSIFANRLLISVRENHYCGATDVDTYLPSVHFMKRTAEHNNGRATANNTIELATFDERLGT
ncbi:hypothetical protein LshimejAT787_0400280 [Lyophyllum shimeji]|uniref:DUF6533 domain-containing protein n=1 Tax=Lyophyllum shimeji TaxID=47721 RepID=A0A9P3PKG8_LYOSH|nr:hypothetical protein LshimejAT787_0400280 [Lyophyllum shimeji]